MTKNRLKAIAAGVNDYSIRALLYAIAANDEISMLECVNSLTDQLKTNVTNQQKLITFVNKLGVRYSIIHMREELRFYLTFDSQRDAMDFVNSSGGQFKVIEIIQDRITCRVTASFMYE